MPLCLQRLMGSSLLFKARLGDRLTVLSTAFAEDYKGGCLSPSAIDALVSFLEADASIGYPDCKSRSNTPSQKRLICLAAPD